ncbi:hypothetical protein DY000_02033876 [Brassica cretica]|uniref:Uncharacterized protein n=1 Tax=Brassica cretica TaxID=69181 RepID=A0ABQ7DLD6_BRACR|nr:hypothetical protein DY000_02033876 [Brassica cretica]
MASSTFKNTNSGADKKDGVEYENFETPDRCGKRKETCTPCEESPEAKKVNTLGSLTTQTSLLSEKALIIPTLSKRAVDVIASADVSGAQNRTAA